MKKQAAGLCRCVRGVAIPLTFLLLFVSLTLTVTITYYFAVAKVTSKTTQLKSSQSRVGMVSLSNDILSVAWAPSSSKIHFFDDYGGSLVARPAAQKLLINLTDNAEFSEVVFDAFVGKLVYQLASSESPSEYFLAGDERVIVNNTASDLARIYVSAGAESQEITVWYRPYASSSLTGFEGGKPQNTIRIYIVTLGSSQAFTVSGSFKLKITCLNVTYATYTYNFSRSIASLELKAKVDNAQTTVSLPISSVAEGAVVRLEVLTCHICLQKVGA
ncbi:MAG: hypothetical protein QXN63_00370 [Candidatus Bathyarchaeia archaeon]